MSGDIFLEKVDDECQRLEFLFMEADIIAMKIGSNYGNCYNSAVYNVAGNRQTEKTKAEKVQNSKNGGVVSCNSNKAGVNLSYDEKAFDIVGPNAPLCVKDAWIESARQVGANGLGISHTGMYSHISQMMVQRIVNDYNGKSNSSDILGNSVESAIQATKQALYNLDHPLEPNTKKSIEVQQALMKEREFYAAFLEKLENCY